MKTIEQAARESADKAWGELDEFTSDKDGEFHYQHTEAFKAGVEFAQRWIPVEEELPEIEIEPYQIECKVKINGQIEIYWIENDTINISTECSHWRPIEYK